jgi:hypothetical protein
VHQSRTIRYVCGAAASLVALSLSAGLPTGTAALGSTRVGRPPSPMRCSA